MAPRIDPARAGLRLRGGLPEDNGLSTRAAELVKSTSTVVYLVASVRVAAVTHNTENDSRTASLKLLAVEAELTDEEASAVQLILDRARVRRTGESPLFDNDGMPADPGVLVQMPAGGRPDKPRRQR